MKEGEIMYTPETLNPYQLALDETTNAGITETTKESVSFSFYFLRGIQSRSIRKT